jgi:hypothetical protein
LTQCYDDLEGRFTAWGLKFGIQAADLTGTDFAEFVVELISTEMAETVLRNVWFGDVETILFIHEYPDGLAVVVGVRLDVRVQVEVLALVVLLVFHVPDPVHGG